MQGRVPDLLQFVFETPAGVQEQQYVDGCKVPDKVDDRRSLTIIPDREVLSLQVVAQLATVVEHCNWNLHIVGSYSKRGSLLGRCLEEKER